MNNRGYKKPTAVAAELAASGSTFRVSRDSRARAAVLMATPDPELETMFVPLPGFLVERTPLIWQRAFVVTALVTLILVAVGAWWYEGMFGLVAAGSVDSSLLVLVAASGVQEDR